MASITFADLFQKWLKQENLKPYKAAPALGVSVAATYEYVNGSSLPPNSRIKHLAACLGCNEKSLRRLITRERTENRKRSGK